MLERLRGKRRFSSIYFSRFPHLVRNMGRGRKKEKKKGREKQGCLRQPTVATETPGYKLSSENRATTPIYCPVDIAGERRFGQLRQLGKRVIDKRGDDQPPSMLEILGSRLSRLFTPA